MNSTYYKSAVLLFTMIFIFNFTPLFAQAQADTESAVKVEQINEHEWNIVNKNGEFVGKLKSESLQTFTFYTTTGMLVGTILESGAWQPRLYRSRETLVQPDEAQLYLDALEATKLIKK